MVDLKVMSFFDYVPPVSDNAFVITNPPYGERLKKEQIDKFYKEMSDRFKQHYSGYDVWLISSNFEALKSLWFASIGNNLFKQWRTRLQVYALRDV